jgi:hypothetical protein
MPGSANLGFPLYVDGMTWTSLLSRQFAGGAAVWDANTSATAVSPMGGVFQGPAGPLQVTQEGTPGMGVLVNAGYCCVPHPTAGHGAYIFGLLAQGNLTVTANSSGQTRVDIVVARVYDLGSSSSYCDVEIIAGTPGSGQPAAPSAALLLAAVTVASGASSITAANITDKRTFTVAPGGVVPASSSALPAAGPGQVVYNTSTGALERGSAAGALVALAAAFGGISDIGTSTGTTGSSGLTAGDSASGYGWGIGYGSTVYSPGGWGEGYGFNADNTIVTEIQVTFTADGQTDFAIDAKWGMAVPEAAADSSSPSISSGQCRIIIMLDNTILDMVCLRCAASGGTTQPGDAGSWTYYTSALQGSTPAAGTHTATLAVETRHTLSGQLSGAHVGNLASTGTSSDAFGSVPGSFTAALTKENCYLRVAGILASTI